MVDYVPDIRYWLATGWRAQHAGTGKWVARYHAVMHLRQLKNVAVSTIFGLAWIAFFLLTAKRGSSLVSPSIPLLAVPLVVGGTFVALIRGELVDRALYALGMPLVPVLVVAGFLSHNTDSEGAGFVWFYASAPLLPFWIGAAGVVIVMLVRKRTGSKRAGQR
jgi:hypothetical protein